ncbi:hypothetical protein AB0D90_14590 [Streptomyces althioticus]|uniref:hypothetical protein n=1 Tax=Streptomyces althioticus TaxID=83380 RepID=UPI0033F1EDA6
MPNRVMPPTERAARDVLNGYVRQGVLTRRDVNTLIKLGLPLAETTVRQHYSPSQTLYYANKVAAAREAFAAATGAIATRQARHRLMLCEMVLAVYKAVQADDRDVAPEDTLTADEAEKVMGTVREVAREMREEAAAAAPAVYAPRELAVA